MLDKKKIEKFWQSRAEIKDPRLATHFKHDDALSYDLAFISNYINSCSHVLDLGCGTGAIANALEPHVSKITVVDKVAEFLKFCIDSPKIIKKTANLPNYTDNNQYDLIVVFGVLFYLNDDEVSQLYKICYGLLKDTGKLLIKHSNSVGEDIIIDNYSEALGQCYHVLYRSLIKDCQLISEFFSKHSVIDIYPTHLNPWPNTHSYAFVVEK